MKIPKAEAQRADLVVAAGAKYLDKKLEGWEYDINLRTLDLGDGCHCVLGQLATDIVPKSRWLERVRKYGKGHLPQFFQVRATLRLSDKRTRTLGFVNTHRTFNDFTLEQHDDGISYPALTQAWKRLINKRLKGTR